MSLQIEDKAQFKRDLVTEESVWTLLRGFHFPATISVWCLVAL